MVKSVLRILKQVLKKVIDRLMIQKTPEVCFQILLWRLEKKTCNQISWLLVISCQEWLILKTPVHIHAGNTAAPETNLCD